MSISFSNASSNQALILETFGLPTLAAKEQLYTPVPCCQEAKVFKIGRSDFRFETTDFQTSDDVRVYVVASASYSIDSSSRMGILKAYRSLVKGKETYFARLLDSFKSPFKHYEALETSAEEGIKEAISSEIIGKMKGMSFDEIIKIDLVFIDSIYEAAKIDLRSKYVNLKGIKIIEVVQYNQTIESVGDGEDVTIETRITEDKRDGNEADTESDYEDEDEKTITTTAYVTTTNVVVTQDGGMVQDEVIQQTENVDVESSPIFPDMEAEVTTNRSDNDSDAETRSFIIQIIEEDSSVKPTTRVSTQEVILDGGFAGDEVTINVVETTITPVTTPVKEEKEEDNSHCTVAVGTCALQLDIGDDADVVDESLIEADVLHTTETAVEFPSELYVEAEVDDEIPLVGYVEGSVKAEIIVADDDAVVDVTVGDVDVETNVDVSFDVDVNIDADVDADVDADADIDADVDADVDADFNADADIDADVDANVDADVDVNIDANVDADIDIDVPVVNINFNADVDVETSGSIDITSNTHTSVVYQTETVTVDDDGNVISSDIITDDSPIDVEIGADGDTTITTSFHTEYQTETITTDAEGNVISTEFDDSQIADDSIIDTTCQTETIIMNSDGEVISTVVEGDCGGDVTDDVSLQVNVEADASNLDEISAAAEEFFATGDEDKSVEISINASGSFS